VVAWLTVHAAIATPDIPLSTNQAKHQRQAVEVLRDLDRGVLRELADERDTRKGRSTNAAAEYDEDTLDALRVAPVGDPTPIAWVRIDADPAAARARIARALTGQLMSTKADRHASS
jgi:hypothetical protein